MGDDSHFARERRMIGLTWIALLLLMLASLGSAYVKLGPWNMVAGLVIATVKAGLVAWLFMRLRRSGPLLRAAALAGVAVLAVLVALSGVDYLTRSETAAALQRPQALLPPVPASSPRGAR